MVHDLIYYRATVVYACIPCGCVSSSSSSSHLLFMFVLNSINAMSMELMFVLQYIHRHTHPAGH